MKNNLTFNFSSYETRCKCGCSQNIIHPETVKLAQSIRDQANIYAKKLGIKKEVSMFITSWNRCEKHNTAIGGSPNSLHLFGWAFDFYFINLSMVDSNIFMKRFHHEQQNGGLGIYHNRYHVDIGTYRYWNDNEIKI